LGNLLDKGIYSRIFLLRPKKGAWFKNIYFLKSRCSPSGALTFQLSHPPVQFLIGNQGSASTLKGPEAADLDFFKGAGATKTCHLRELLN
jgi:hypothetical protein